MFHIKVSVRLADCVSGTIDCVRAESSLLFRAVNWEGAPQFLLCRAPVSPSILKTNSRTFCYKAGGRELMCSLAMTSICVESPSFFHTAWGRPDHSFPKMPKPAQGSSKREEEEGGRFRAALKSCYQKNMLIHNFLNSGTSPAFCFPLCKARGMARTRWQPQESPGLQG